MAGAVVVCGSYVYVCMRLCTYYIYMGVYVLYILGYVRIYMYIYAYIRKWVCIYIYMWVCLRYIGVHASMYGFTYPYVWLPF